MPGPISDAYDPEFGTAANAADVSMAICDGRKKLDAVLGNKLKDIVQVAKGKDGKTLTVRLSEREARALRFAVNRALESL